MVRMESDQVTSKPRQKHIREDLGQFSSYANSVPRHLASLRLHFIDFFLTGTLNQNPQV